MDYNLAKELKEAGFPDSNQWLDGGNGFWVDMGEFSYVVPTLEELVEACGGGFVRMEKYDGEFICFDGYEPTKTDPKGKTPSEAVARLWLAINKK